MSEAIPKPSPSIIASKTQSACSECRVRKLKCSGEASGCVRCFADGIPCRYSPRKQMGRPRKRKNHEETLNQDLNPWTSAPGYEGDNSVQPSANEATFTTSHAEVPMPLPSSNFTGLQLNGPQNFAQIYNTSSQDFSFDFSQELSTDLSQYFPELVSQSSLPDFSSDINTAQLHTPASTSIENISQSSTSNTPPGGCTCLPQLYAMLSEFQSCIPPSFPYSMSTLRKGASLATEVVRCTRCVKEHNLALQNVMLLGTLMNLLINEYRKLLDHIDERAHGTANGMALRIGEHIPGTEHLHTGTVDCPMAFDIELCGPEWRILARKVVAREVLGSPCAGDGQSLAQILQEMRVRQVKLHAKNSNGQLGSHGKPVEAHVHGGEHGKDGCVCLQVVFIERLRESLDCLNL